MTAFEEKYLNMAKEIVLAHIPKEEYAVFLFGSRANGKSKVNSDFDIGILGEEKLPNKIAREIKDEIDESRIPHKVDLIDFKSVDEKFRNIALEKIILWNTPKSFTPNLTISESH